MIDHGNNTHLSDPEFYNREPAEPHWPSLVSHLSAALETDSVAVVVENYAAIAHEDFHERIQGLGQLIVRAAEAKEAARLLDAAVETVRGSGATWSDVGRAVGTDPSGARRRWGKEPTATHGPRSIGQ